MTISFPLISKKDVLLVFLGLLILLSPSRLFAQQRENESDVFTRELEAIEKTEKVEEQAEKRRITEKIRKVTYRDILNDPDNIKLNFVYAQNQVAEGNLLAAATSLERILLVNPDLDKVRLFYAIVLYRLDNWTEAREQLQTLLKRENLQPSLRAEVNEYVKRLNRRLRQTLFTLRQSIGYQFDTNRNAAPSSKKRSFGNVLLPVAATSGRKNDTSFINVTNISVLHDLGTQAGHEVFGSFTYFLQEQTKVDSLDLQSFQYEVGTNLKSRIINVTPRFYVSHLFLSRETFLRTQGGAVEIDRQLSKKLNAYSEFKIEYQNFSGISENSTAAQRKGRYLELETGFNYVLIPTMRVSTSFLYGNKAAKVETNAYERIQLNFSHTWLLGKGQFLINSVDLGRDVYNERDAVIAAKFRRENSIRYRVTYGLPLESIPFAGRHLPGFFKDMTLTGVYEYYRSLSNITNYTYYNNKFQGMLSKKLEF